MPKVQPFNIWNLQKKTYSKYWNHNTPTYEWNRGLKNLLSGQDMQSKKKIFEIIDTFSKNNYNLNSIDQNYIEKISNVLDKILFYEQNSDTDKIKKIWNYLKSRTPPQAAQAARAAPAAPAGPSTSAPMDVVDTHVPVIPIVITKNFFQEFFGLDETEQISVDNVTILNKIFKDPSIKTAAEDIFQRPTRLSIDEIRNYIRYESTINKTILGNDYNREQEYIYIPLAYFKKKRAHLPSSDINLFTRYNECAKLSCSIINGTYGLDISYCGSPEISAASRISVFFKCFNIEGCIKNEQEWYDVFTYICIRKRKLQLLFHEIREKLNIPFDISYKTTLDSLSMNYFEPKFILYTLKCYCEIIYPPSNCILPEFKFANIIVKPTISNRKRYIHNEIQSIDDDSTILNTYMSLVDTLHDFRYTEGIKDKILGTYCVNEFSKVSTTFGGILNDLGGDKIENSHVDYINTLLNSTLRDEDIYSYIENQTTDIGKQIETIPHTEAGYDEFLKKIKEKRQIRVILGHPSETLADGTIAYNAIGIFSQLYSDDRYGQKSFKNLLLTFFNILEPKLEINSSSGLAYSDPTDIISGLFENSTAAVFDSSANGAILNKAPATMYKDRQQLFELNHIHALTKDNQPNTLIIDGINILYDGCSIKNMALKGNISSYAQTGNIGICPQLTSLLKGNDEKTNVRILFDLKRAGDLLQAEMALANDKIFVTGDRVAAVYARLIGCDTILTKLDCTIGNKAIRIIEMYKGSQLASAGPFTAGPFTAGPSSIFDTTRGGSSKPKEPTEIKRKYKKIDKLTFIPEGKLNELVSFIKNMKKGGNTRMKNQAILHVEPTSKYHHTVNDMIIPFNLAVPEFEKVLDEINTDYNISLSDYFKEFLIQKKLNILSYSYENYRRDENINVGMIAEFLVEASLDLHRNLVSEYIKFIKTPKKLSLDGGAKTQKEISAIPVSIQQIIKEYIQEVFKFRYNVKDDFDLFSRLFVYNTLMKNNFIPEREKEIKPNMYREMKVPDTLRPSTTTIVPTGKARAPSQAPPQALPQALSVRPKAPSRAPPVPSRALPAPSRVPSRAPIGRGGSSQQNKQHKEIEDFQNKLIKLYTKYVKLCKSSKEDHELKNELTELESKISSLSAKINDYSEKQNNGGGTKTMKSSSASKSNTKTDTREKLQEKLQKLRSDLMIHIDTYGNRPYGDVDRNKYEKEKQDYENKIKKIEEKLKN